ncbi:MAG: Na+/H+ antiporter NhaC [Pseudohongiellaceae bacterium]|jgi:Na+/H+ antiporter NhaC
MNETDITSLIPIAVALVLSLTTRNVIVGLFTGVFAGVLMINGPQPFAALGIMVKSHLIPELTDSYNAGVLILLAFIGGFVALVEQSGGGAAFAKRINHWVKTPMQAQIAAWLGGISIFFSDLGTPLIVGPVFRPLMDRLQVSREKLAYIIDSTASPVAILVPFIGWGVYIMSLIYQEYEALGIEESEFTAFILTIPFQFYAWLAVLMVPLLAVLNLDFGAMAKVEGAQVKKAQVVKDQKGIKKEASDNSSEQVKAFTHPNAKPILVWAPLLVMACVLALMLVPLGFPLEQVSGTDFRAGLSTSYFFAAAVLIVLMSIYKVRGFLSSIDIYLKGVSGMMLVAITLLLAWALSDIGRQLGAAEYIAEVTKAGLPVWMFPMVAFLLSAIISFATGSSWGTFAIMLPLVIPTAYGIEAPMYACIGAVLSGGLFGDHSSPISETTILASTGASCPQIEHFRTQLPYALFNGSISLVGFAVAGITGSSIIVISAIMVQVVVLTLIKKMQRKKELVVSHEQQ